MNRFDEKYNTILNEIFGTLASAAGSFLKAGKDPSYLFNMKNQGKKGKKDIYDKKNFPKVGKLVVYGNNHEVIGKIVTPLNKEQQFGVQLIKPNNQPSDFMFVKTEKEPRWRIDSIEKINTLHINGKDMILKDNKGILQSSPTKEIPYVMVGKNTRFENWISYDDYIKQNKK